MGVLPTGEHGHLALAAKSSGWALLNPEPFQQRLKLNVPQELSGRPDDEDESLRPSGLTVPQSPFGRGDWLVGPRFLRAGTYPVQQDLSDRPVAGLSIQEPLACSGTCQFRHPEERFVLHRL